MILWHFRLCYSFEVAYLQERFYDLILTTLLVVTYMILSILAMTG